MKRKKKNTKRPITFQCICSDCKNQSNVCRYEFSLSAPPRCTLCGAMLLTLRDAITAGIYTINRSPNRKSASGVGCRTGRRKPG